MRITLEIEKHAPPGDGLGFYNGKAVFVPATTVGDVVEASIVKEKKRFIIARLESVIKPSDKRVDPICPHYTLCGGCSLMHLTLDDQLDLKKQMLVEVFSDFGFAIEPKLIPSPKSTYFRYRTQLKCSEGIVGFSARNTNTVIEITDCKILSEGILANLDRIRKLGRVNCEFNLLESSNSGEVGLSVYEKKKNRSIPGFPEKVTENYGYGDLSLNSSSFAQSNPFVTKLIIQDLVNQIKPAVTVHELYCGCGTFSIPIAKLANRLIGYELSKSSVLAAEKNAELNNLENAKFISINLEKPTKLGKPDLIVADPPRKGLNTSLIDSIHNTTAETFLYVSCNPSTLARDAASLQKLGGFQLQELTAYDMYCHSTHQELLAVFKR